ncbi:MAG: sodium-dependent transporter, partial [Halioglobus sp.]|nr:sodium-dependent transporter [Halioglobus sp.]
EKLLLPVGGLLIAVFVAWAVHKATTRDELAKLSATGYSVWYALLRYVVPPAILIVLFMGLGG